MKKYFSFDRDNGFNVHETAEEAKEAAINALYAYRDSALYDGWDEQTDDLCWGEITQAATRKDLGHQVEFEGEMVDAVDYALEDVSAA